MPINDSICKAPPASNFMAEKYDLDETEKNVDLARAVKKAASEQAKRIHTLAEEMEEAKLALLVACQTVRVDASECFSTEMPKLLKEVRELRMALGSECSVVMKHLGDLRRFFHGPEYQQELSRLREFTELCERLKALKESGFLDTVADTMLNLSERRQS